MILILVWDGFLILGEGLGLPNRAARRFADVAWLLSATLTTAYVLALGLTLEGIIL